MIAPQTRKAPDQTRPVVLLHGLGRTRASMWLLARGLRAAGFDAKTLGYPSTRMTVSEACAHAHDALLAQFGESEIDLVGHSLGGVIARHVCISSMPPLVRHVVQIGAPNLGSPLADRMLPFWAVRKACGPALDGLKAQNGQVPRDPRITAIAGVTCIGWRKSRNQMLTDGVVSVRSAWAGAGRRRSAHQIHTLMPASPKVGRLVVEALLDAA